MTEQTPQERLADCPTCSGPIRETVGLVCQTCGTDYGQRIELATLLRNRAFPPYILAQLSLRDCEAIAAAILDSDVIREIKRQSWMEGRTAGHTGAANPYREVTGT